MNARCGCCEGVDPLTPGDTSNRPRLGTLVYRVGTHASFLETMKANLSARGEGEDVPPLVGLATRDAGDPSIALLDAWAVVADVLSFYNERLANEGYLRTAVHRRSLVELARLVGYKPRPGVSASTFLAFTLDAPPATAAPAPAIPGLPPSPAPARLPVPTGSRDEITIPKGTRAQTQPGQGELPQPFETDQAITARAAWNALRPRMTKPQALTCESVLEQGIWFSGIGTDLKVNDPLLIDYPNGLAQIFRVTAVDPEPSASCTRVRVELWDAELMPFLGSLLARLARAMFERFSQLADFGIPSDGPDLQKALKALTEVTTSAPAGTDVAKANQRFDAASQRLKAELLPLSSSGIDEIRKWGEKLGLLLTPVEELFARVKKSEDEAAQSQAKCQASHREAAATAPTRYTPESIDVTIDKAIEAISTQQITKGDAETVTSKDWFNEPGGAAAALLTKLRVGSSDSVYDALRGFVTLAPRAEVFAFRAQSGLFGNNAPMRTTVPATDAKMAEPEEWEDTIVSEMPLFVFLAGSYPKIPQQAWMIIERPSPQEDDDPGSTLLALLKQLTVARYTFQVREESRAAYAISGPTTRLVITAPWFGVDPDLGLSMVQMETIRRTRVYAQAESLALAEMPITDPVCRDEVVLQSVYESLAVGRPIIITGERATDSSGIKESHLAMLCGSDVVGDPTLPGDTLHTLATFTPPLPVCLKRDTVVIYANVAHATHGESRQEVLGGADAAVANQSFTLKQ